MREFLRVTIIVNNEVKIVGLAMHEVDWGPSLRDHSSTSPCTLQTSQIFAENLIAGTHESISFYLSQYTFLPFTGRLLDALFLRHAQAVTLLTFIPILCFTFFINFQLYYSFLTNQVPLFTFLTFSSSLPCTGQSRDDLFLRHAHSLNFYLS